jgi:integrase
MDGFEPWLRANNCCEGTITGRLYVLADFARSNPAFPDVNAGQISNWLGRPDYAQWTRSTYFGHLRSYFAWAAAEGVIRDDPMVGMRWPKRRAGTPRPLTPEQVHQVLAAASPRMRAWLTLGLYAGLRAHEIAKIRGEDVDVDQLYVMGKGGFDAYLPTHPLVWAVAQTMPRTGWWFPCRDGDDHTASKTISTLTTRLFKANNLTGSIHRCRHTYATELLRAGVNVRVVQTLMRHQSLASTMIYTAVDEVERRDAIALLVAA